MILIPLLLLCAPTLTHGSCVVGSQCNAPFGACVNGVCNCDAGFLPPNCAAFCTNRTGCTNHGDCVSANDIPKCACDPGWGAGQE